MRGTRDVDGEAAWVFLVGREDFYDPSCPFFPTARNGVNRRQTHAIKLAFGGHVSGTEFVAIYIDSRR